MIVPELRQENELSFGLLVQTRTGSGSDAAAEGVPTGVLTYQP